MRNDRTGGQLAERRMTIDEEARFLGLVPEDVKQFVLHEAAINWCAKAVYQLYQLNMEQDGPATIAYLKQCERDDLRGLLHKQDNLSLRSASAPNAHPRNRLGPVGH